MPKWRKLLAFAKACLAKPTRGGARRNLTSQVMKQVDAFVHSPVVSFPSPPRQAKAQRTGTIREATDDDMVARRAASKLNEGDIKGAIQVLSSSAKLVPITPEVLDKLKSKHPPEPADAAPPPPPPATAPLQVDNDQVAKAVRSFSPSSAGSIDGLRPQHLRDLLDCASGEPLLCALTDLVNLALAGQIPETVRPDFFGANLLAFSKPDGGIRPIAVGYVMRRLVSKCACFAVNDEVASLLSPRQVGVGIKGGCEAAVHACRSYLEDLQTSPLDKILVKLDFVNAFNSVRRDVLLQKVHKYLPQLYPLAQSSYGAVSSLVLGDHTVDSAEGVQQGDPLGPLFFCLVIHDLLCTLSSEFVAGYLDDVSCADAVSTVVHDIKVIIDEGALLGLQLNAAKCEVIGLSHLSPSARSEWDAANLGFKDIDIADTTLLGAAILPGAEADKKVNQRQIALETMAARLGLLSAHHALFLLQHALAIPKLMYLLRCSVCSVMALEDYDNALRKALVEVLNFELPDDRWAQASLPVKFGGIGVRKGLILAPSAFLASVSATSQLVQGLLPSRFSSSRSSSQRLHMERQWSQLSASVPIITGDAVIHQSRWDEVVCSAEYQKLLDGASSELDHARLLAARESGEWLKAYPFECLGLHLDNEAVRFNLHIRLGGQAVAPHKCQLCGVQVAPDGLHCLGCVKSAGRHARHQMGNAIIFDAVKKAGCHSVLEPTGLVRGDGKRPDGATTIPWKRGRLMCWDFTCTDTFCQSNLPASILKAGAAADARDVQKCKKYQSVHSHEFIPIAVETTGVLGPHARSFLKDLGKRLIDKTGDLRESAFLRQRLDIAICRGNAMAFRGSYIGQASSGIFLSMVQALSAPAQPGPM